MSDWYQTHGSPKAYDEYFEKWSPKLQRQVEHPWPFKIMMVKKAKGLVLDAGCGYGGMAKFIKNGVFLDFSRVALMKRWVDGKRPRILASVEDMPFRDGVFDSAIAIEVIEHTNNPKRFVREVYRVLKKGGFFGLSFPWSDVSPAHHFKRITKGMIHKWINPPFKKYKFGVPPLRKERGMVYTYK